MVAGALQGQTEAIAEGPSEQRASGRSDPNGALAEWRGRQALKKLFIPYIIWSLSLILVDCFLFSYKKCIHVK